jgi:hypothetical protein
MVKNTLLNWWLDKVNDLLKSQNVILDICTYNYNSRGEKEVKINLSNFNYTLTNKEGNGDNSTPNFDIRFTSDFMGIKDPSPIFKRDMVRNIFKNLGNKIFDELTAVSRVYALEVDGEKLYFLLDKDRHAIAINPYRFPHNVDTFFQNLISFNFLSSYSSTMGFGQVLNPNDLETAYNLKPVIVDLTPIPTNLATCDEENKYRVFVKRELDYYGSFTIDPEQVDIKKMFPRCEISGYILTHLSNNFNERENVYKYGDISNYVLRNMFVNCSFCGELHKKENNETAYICNGCKDEISKYDLDLEVFANNRYRIFDYDYKQQLYFLDTPNDTDKRRLYLGVELEVDTEYLDDNDDNGNPCGCGDDGCDECEQYYNRESNGTINHSKYANIVLHKLNGKEQGKVFAKHDGSLNSGFEIVSQPATYLAHTENNLINWVDSMRVLKDIGYTSHNLGTCGLHIHINRDFFGEGRDAQNYNGAKIVYLMEKYWRDFVLFSRRRGNQLDRWAKIQNAKNDFDNNNEKTTDSLRYAFQKNYYENRDKYIAVNTLHNATFEFRIFRGTLNYETFKATLQFVDNLARLVKKTTLTKLTSITFEDILNFKKYPELNAYWSKRKSGTLTGDNTPQ